MKAWGKPWPVKDIPEGFSDRTRAESISNRWPDGKAEKSNSRQTFEELTFIALENNERNYIIENAVRQQNKNQEKKHKFSS